MSEATPAIGVYNHKPQIVVVDDFLTNPKDYRELALRQEYRARGSQGVRSEKTFATPTFKMIFEQLLGLPITKWDYDLNGVFQYCTAKDDKIVYHVDNQTHAAVLFLTPGAPVDAGLTLYRSRVTGHRCNPNNAELYGKIFDQGRAFFDYSKFEPIDQIGNVFNRLVLFPGVHIHAPSRYFGHDIHTGRLFQIFFFDCGR